ncbi:alpha/beta fold hydrolase [Methylobacterium sp. ap11]|uniref:PHA/PHB synthase family protein n=1 Tax=Methylobacterium sp. ap11 TaxID=1761799 RepID=UPI001FCDCC1D|nr:alpha/beta fold hydrolase [Methylobacterium sp. ap11]
MSATSEAIDEAVHAAVASATGGLSPAALADAWGDWAVHLAFSPGKQAELVVKAARKGERLAGFVLRSLLQGGRAEPCIRLRTQDHRFDDPAWQVWPFSLIMQSFLLAQQWWQTATTGVRGVSHAHEAMVAFMVRQMLDAVAPSNTPLTNPVVLAETLCTGGENLNQGSFNLIEDALQLLADEPMPAGPEGFKVGRDVAVTPGRVIHRKRLIELIRYDPATEAVRPEPILIVPAWIEKYYILDLSPENSLVRYLVGQGFTVFMISWRNPGFDDRDLSFDDYCQLGVIDALDSIGGVLPGRVVHLAGYCLGGTLAAIAAAAIARDGDGRLSSLTLFVNESQVTFLESLMRSTGTLDAQQMAGAFRLLRSNDLIWSRMVNSYLLGRREETPALAAWNADATRMPVRMQSEYLRRLFLDNDLAKGRFRVGGRPVALGDIRVPVFADGTERDHIAPWRSVFKLTLLTKVEVTFVLASGGHNAGIVAAPEESGRRCRVHTRTARDRYLDPDTWTALARATDGSWWLEWTTWLAARSGEPTAPPLPGPTALIPADLGPAPGTYVLEA